MKEISLWVQFWLFNEEINFFKAMIVYWNSRIWYYDKLTNEYICLRIVKKNLKFRKFIAEIHEE